ncbi:hypothetical protein CDIK_2858 [Cucumispora dikerogammari]|nr:hypothetical protein CDIK_2858 [Cucumispora dikerogammari]
MLLLVLSIIADELAPIEEDNIDSEQKTLINQFNYMKHTIVRIHECNRKEMLKTFQSRFKKLIQKSSVYPYLSCKFSKDDISLLKPEIPDLSKLSSQYFHIQKNMRTLFFTDFIPFCYEFLAEINRQCIMQTGPRKCFNSCSLAYMFNKLDPSVKFATENCININFFESISNPDISFTYLLNSLEAMVSENSNNSIEFIRKCLYFNPGFFFDVSKEQNIRDFYHIITYFFKHYGTSCYSRDVELFSSYVSKIIKPQIKKAKVIIKVLIKYYQPYLIIDVDAGYSYCPANKFCNRFITYRT